MLSKKSKAQNLRVIKDALWTQKKLAIETDIHEVRLSRGLKGEVDFTEIELDKIATTLKVQLILSDDTIKKVTQ